MIRASHVWKRFRGLDALRDLSLTVPAGSTFALVGANGAGKTTTIKLLMNVVQPTRGTLMVLGVDSRRLSANELARIGYVSEHQRMPGRMRAISYINYLRPFYPQWDCALEAAIVTRLRLPLERKIGALSHGTRLKLALACALPFHPKLLVLDEPFSGLDPLVRDEFMDGLLRHAGEITILISSHELTEIEDCTTHLAFLDQGRLLLQEPMDSLKARLRRVRITFDGPALLPAQVPGDWLEASVDGNEATFIDTQFCERQLGPRIESVFGPGARMIQTQQVALRSIFTTLARAARERKV